MDQDLDSIFFMRTPAGDNSHADLTATMSPAFRRMLGALDGSRSLADLAKLFPQLDAEDLRLWVSELVRQKLIKRAPTLTISQRMRLSQPPAKVEKQVSRIAEELEPWLQNLDAAPAAPAPVRAPTAQVARTARLAAIEANTTAESVSREGYFLEPQSKAKPLAAGAQPLILVVEDDPLQAAVVVKILEKEHYHVRVARDGLAVIAALRLRPVPDLVLLDVELPDTDGFRILEKLRAHRNFRKVRVVMMTGRGDRADIAKGVLLGADGYLTKPFRPEMIKMAVRQALRPV